MSIAEDAQRRRPSEDDADNSQALGGSARRKTGMGRKLRVLTVEKGLLRETKTVQKMLDALVECRVSVNNHFISCASELIHSYSVLLG